MTALRIYPSTISAAKAFVAEHHRHHRAPVGGLFAVSVVDDRDRVRGVAIVGRPVARKLCDGVTAEVTRVCTDGARNACSMLLGACAKALGYRRLVTYTLATESGSSLRGAGWIATGEAGGGGWSRPSRKRVDDHPTCPKVRWEAYVGKGGER